MLDLLFACVMFIPSCFNYRVTLRQFSAFACCRIFGAGVSSFVTSVGLIVLFLFDSYVDIKVMGLTYCLHVLRSFHRVFILPYCDDSQLAFFALIAPAKHVHGHRFLSRFPLFFCSPVRTHITAPI